MKKVLFIHQNFPGQFRHLAGYLAGIADVDTLAIGRDTAPGMSKVKLVRYRPKRAVGKNTHPYIRSFEDAVLHGQQVLRILLDLKGRGYFPDVIVAHPGWGETLYVKDAYPTAKLIHLCEFYYQAEGADAGFDDEFPIDVNTAASIRTRNALHLLNLENCDVGVSPTQWQRSLHPEVYKNKIRVIHEGIDVNLARPNKDAIFELPDGQLLRSGMPIITYVARNLEPYRGFHIFMRALVAILERCPDCHVLIVGGDEVSYGAKPNDAQGWREKLQREVLLDSTRVHFLGKLPYNEYLKVLQVSRVHVYLTYPFVLSWSFLEAMACGCAIVASRTAPLFEFMKQEKSFVDVPFFDIEAIQAHVVQLMENETFRSALGHRARNAIYDFDKKIGINRYCDLIKEICSG